VLLILEESFAPNSGAEVIEPVCPRVVIEPTSFIIEIDVRKGRLSGPPVVIGGVVVNPKIVGIVPKKVKVTV
jgi:hypothetical protein